MTGILCEKKQSEQTLSILCKQKGEVKTYILYLFISEKRNTKSKTRDWLPTMSG